MDSLYDGRKKTGYSLEEAYFHSENKRLIQEFRAKNGTEAAPNEDGAEGVVIDAQARFQERRDENTAKEKPKGKKAA